MSVDGTWNMTVKSPMGPMQGTLVLKEGNGALSGTQSGQGNTSEITEGKVDGDNVSWTFQTTKPMPLKLEFSATVAGSSMSGTAKAGAFGSFPFTAERA